MITPSDRDWPTRHQENGNYLGKCHVCGATYIGPKRSMSCYPCNQQSQRDWDAMTPEQQHEATMKFADGMARLSQLKS